MSKIHPAAENGYQYQDRGVHHDQVEDVNPSVLTVWKRSSMTFQGTDGFTVFDHQGVLTFRVDNYSRKSCGVRKGLVLMDGAGRALLTLKPQVFSMQDQWNAYQGDYGCAKSPKSSRVFTMRNTGSGLFSRSNKSEVTAEVFMGSETTSLSSPDFRIEGCFWRRKCNIKSSSGQLVANVARKRVNNTVMLGEDVFSLVVQPGFDLDLIMAFVIILDRICGKPLTPILCS
ncbi:protein LURP-one-related 5-like [Argentina anserina]|uniref:protein LURP-one-related 5-like n=1 Tax=Argentina anserina TaxID=57926 RepID=UPI0021767F11|nr:protein LURP-one-related 5-like [Potentilla anserina]